MDDAPDSVGTTVRPAVLDDAEGIARVYLESAEHHAQLEPERYRVPAAETISARYREGRQHLADVDSESITFVAELGGAIVGFVDVRLDRSPDPMHREMVFCHIVEIAVSLPQRSQGIGGRLLRTAEEWGRERGADMASLEYLAANPRAGEFYQRRMGYRVAAIMAIKRLRGPE